MKEWNGRKLISMEDWTGNFSDIASPGDLVDEEIVDEMINCVPPACMKSSCTQCGEPYSHKEDENGKLIWECPNCGNQDQDKLFVARRTCGYIGTQFWNQGRTQEIKDRVLHL